MKALPRRKRPEWNPDRAERPRWTTSARGDSSAGDERAPRRHGRDGAAHTSSALPAAYPGGVADRVVKLSDGESEVHNIGVNRPYHVFVDRA